MLPNVEEIKSVCNKLNINPYFVCSEKGTVVYIARTEDEANEFIKSHNLLIELHIEKNFFEITKSQRREHGRKTYN